MLIDEVISIMGGLHEAAAKCGITPNAVRKWKRNGLPALQWKQISRITGIPLDVLADVPKPEKRRSP